MKHPSDLFFMSVVTTEDIPISLKLSQKNSKEKTARILIWPQIHKKGKNYKINIQYTKSLNMRTKYFFLPASRVYFRKWYYYKYILS